ncbi:MAG: hypothetical protein GF311_13060 [Candidatus Lokiarchaeota archaeon]|nr:hypothetical protein [Candidatus Lokiarchaeota archaeon]
MIIRKIMVWIENVKFCVRCGIKFSEYTSSYPNYCPNCGIRVRSSVQKEDLKQCAICHYKVRGPDLIICPFCESIFHYRCIFSWIGTQNICPVCLNTYIHPKSIYK